MSDDTYLVDPTLVPPIPSPDDEEDSGEDKILEHCVKNIGFVLSKNRSLMDDAELAFNSLLDRKPHVAVQFQTNILKALQLEADMIKLLLAIRESLKKEKEGEDSESKYVDNRKIVINLDSQSRRMLADVISGKFSGSK